MTLLHLKKREILVLLSIILFGLFLRVYKLPAMVGFDFDQEYAAQFADTILKIFPFAMIGQGLSVQGLFMGPFYFYFLVPFFALTQMHPIGGYIGSILLCLGGIIVSYILLRHVFNKTAGIIGALFSATFILYIKYSWSMTPAYTSVFIVFITWFCLYAYWHKNTSFLPILGFIFGLYSSFHPILFPFYFIFVFIFLMKRTIPSLKITLFSLMLFLVPLIPLILFEYFRHFLEIKTLLSLRGSPLAEPKNLATFIDYVMILLRFPEKLLNIHLKEIITIVFSGLIYFTFLILHIKKIGFWKDRFHGVILLTTIVVFLGYYYVLPTHVPDYYFLGAESIIFIYIVATLSLLVNTKVKFVLPVIIGITLFFNLSSIITLWRSPAGNSLAAKDYILLAIKERQKDNSDFAIMYNIDPGQEYGLGYLTRLYKIEPRGQSKLIYEIVIPASRTKEKLDILTPSEGIGVVIHDRTKSE